MNILVTGGMGYIGSHTVVKLLQAGHNVTIYDNLSNSNPIVFDRIVKLSGQRPIFVEGDVRDEKMLSKVFRYSSIDYVIHFAGLKSVGESTKIPMKYYDVNVTGTINILKVMERHEVYNLIFSSSATVYEAQKGNTFVPYIEHHKLGTINPYGATKLMAENIMGDLAKYNDKWSFSMLRYFNPVGAHPSGIMGEDPSDTPNNLAPYITGVMAKRYKEVNVFGNDYDTPDGTGVRDYIHVEDLADAHVAALNWMNNRISSCGAIPFNIGTGKGTSVMEMIATFSKVSGIDIPYAIQPRREGDVATCYADTSFAKFALNWTSKYSVEDMCRDAWNWQKNNPGGYV